MLLESKGQRAPTKSCELCSCNAGVSGSIWNGIFNKITLLNPDPQKWSFIITELTSKHKQEKNFFLANFLWWSLCDSHRPFMFICSQHVLSSLLLQTPQSWSCNFVELLPLQGYAGCVTNVTYANSNSIAPCWQAAERNIFFFHRFHFCQGNSYYAPFKLWIDLLSRKQAERSCATIEQLGRSLYQHPAKTSFILEQGINYFHCCFLQLLCWGH